MRTIIILSIVILLFSACTKNDNPTVIQQTVATPSISPDGGVFSSARDVSITCSTSGAEIRYTLDGTEPTENSQLYSTMVRVDSTLTVKAKAFKSKWKPSNTASKQYSFQVSDIFISPFGGAYISPQAVQLISGTPGTVIYYTIDGTLPTHLSAVYSNPITIDHSLTLKAKGEIAGWAGSPVVTANFTLQVEQPTFSIEPGTYYNTFSVGLATPTEGAVIRYTKDNTEPTETSAIYSTPLSITINTIIKAKAFKQGWNPSDMSTGAYNLKVTATSFSPLPASYYTSQTVTISNSTPGVKIYYTTNGMAPTTASAVYTSPISITNTTTLKAIAVKTGWVTSNVSTGNYNFEIFAPKFSLPGGVYSGVQSVSISCATPGTIIRYTTSTYDPNTNSPQYLGPIQISSSTMLKAKAYKQGFFDSPVTTANYEFSNLVSNPVFSVSGGEYHEPTTVAITCATQGATIRYTLDNSEPSSLTPVYSHPFVLHSNTTIKAKAFFSDWVPSQTITANYLIYVPLEMVYIPGGTFMMGDTHGLGIDDAVPTHLVTLSSYYIGNFEITQQEWQSVMGYNPSYHNGNVHNPVESISSYACMVYCNKKSISEGLTPVYSLNNITNPDYWGPIPTSETWDWMNMVCNWGADGYRLPTEAEWEYAARGASVNPDYSYSGGNNLYDLGWYAGNGLLDTHPVGQKTGNSKGLYDMSGNVSEWCWDWYDSLYYQVGNINNPHGPVTNSNISVRSIRGGCFMDSQSGCLIQMRNSFGSFKSPSYIGFRIVRSNLSKK